jgi:hypothetical protein
MCLQLCELSVISFQMARAVWIYYMAKIIELLDTVFFVLRKKTSQVSFLHVYHHTLMPICAFIGVKYLAGGHGTLLGVINSFIHVLMYTYYLLSAMPSMQKFLWWKKYLTLLQIVSGIVMLFRRDFSRVNFLIIFHRFNFSSCSATRFRSSSNRIAIFPNPSVCCSPSTLHYSLICSARSTSGRTTRRGDAT